MTLLAVIESIIEKKKKSYDNNFLIYRVRTVGRTYLLFTITRQCRSMTNVRYFPLP